MEELLTSMLAGVAGGKRYWLRAPQKDKPPFVVMNLVSRPRDYNFQRPTGYVVSRFQIDCYADTYTAAKGLARQVRAAVSGRRFGIVQGIFIDSERDLPAADAGEVKHLFRTSLDIIVHHIE